MRQLRASTQTILSQCRFPYADLELEAPDSRIVQHWISMWGHLLTSSVTLPHLERLLHDLLTANGISHSALRQAYERILGVINVQKNRKNVDLPLQLITLLTKELNLSVEGNTDAFHRHTLFPEWYSEFLEDSWFGSHGTSLEMSLQGSNTYLNLLNSSESFINLMLSKVVAHLASEPPTRTLVVGKREHLDKFINDVRIMKILDLKLHGVDVSLVLALNKASLVVDPIKWSLLISEIRGWGEMHQITVTFSESTDAMFRERQIPGHPPRSQQQESPSKLFPFYVLVHLRSKNFSLDRLPRFIQ